MALKFSGAGVFRPAVRSWGFNQSASKPCEPRLHQTCKKASSGIPALSASRLAPASTVSVTGARLALRSASQSPHVCGSTSPGHVRVALRLRGASPLSVFISVFISVLVDFPISGNVDSPDSGNGSPCFGQSIPSSEYQFVRS